MYLKILFFLFFLAFPMASIAQNSTSCETWRDRNRGCHKGGLYSWRDNFAEIKKSDSNRMESDLYLIKVPSNFNTKKADVLATYKTISSRQKPTHQCVFTDLFYYTEDERGHRSNLVPDQPRYKNGVCKNLKSGSVTSVWNGMGIRIGQDGYQEKDVYCANYDDCALIEDLNGIRIVTENFGKDLYYNLGHEQSSSFSSFSRWSHTSTTWTTGDLRNNSHVIKDCSSGSIEAISFYYAFPGYAILEKSVETSFVITYKPPKIQIQF